MSGLKNERLSGEFRRVLSQLITTEVQDDRIEMKVSVMDVQVTSDLDVAKVYVSVMGDERDKTRALEALEHAKGFLKSRLAQTVKARKIPDLKFVLDTSIDNSVRVQELLDEIKEEEHE